MTEFFLHTGFSVMIALSCFLLCKQIQTLRTSPIARLIFVPVWFLVCFQFTQDVDPLSDALSSLLEGYLFFQLVNLANTSRRTQRILCALHPKHYKHFEERHSEDRIQSLLSAGTIRVDGTQFFVNKNGNFWTMRTIAKFVAMISIIRY